MRVGGWRLKKNGLLLLGILFSTLVVIGIPHFGVKASNTNLAVIPNDFSLVFGNENQYAFVDTNITHNGNPSIRVEPDYTGSREVDGIWYNVTPGDHVVASCWMRVLTNSSTSDYPQCGARIGIDFYGYVNGVFTLLTDEKFWYNFYNDGNYSLGYVQDSNNCAWQQRIIDITVPVYATDNNGNVATVTALVMWLQGAPWGEDPSASPTWFADAELYINPIPPLIVIASGGTTVTTGQVWAFSLQVFGGLPPYTFQWYEEADKLQGQTNPELTVTEDHSGVFNFFCQVTDANNSTVTSNVTTLKVINPIITPSPTIDPAPSARPTPSPTTSPTPSPTITPTSSPTPTSAASPTPTLTPTITPKPTYSPTPTITPTPSSTFSPTLTPKVTPTQPEESSNPSVSSSSSPSPVQTSNPNSTTIPTVITYAATSIAVILIATFVILKGKYKSSIKLRLHL